MKRPSELMRVDPEFKKLVRELKKQDYETDAIITKQLANMLKNKRKRIIEL